MKNFNYEVGKITKFIYDNTNTIYLARVSKFTEKECYTKGYLNITSSLFIGKVTGIFYVHSSIETPTFEEMKWFEACERENKFIPFEEISIKI